MNIRINDKTILYHGSKGGIIGELKINSPNKNRKNNPADFGDGFYLGTNPNQAKGVCVEHEKPVFYEMLVKFSMISQDRILVLDNKQWLYTVLAYRKKSAIFSSLPLAEDIIRIVDSYDFVIGNIADDRMNEAINEFNNGNLSDKGLEACLKYIDYGSQIVVKTPQINELVHIVSEKEIRGFELDNIQSQLYSDRRKSRNIIREMSIKYRRSGLFIDEIEDMAKKGQINIKDIFPQNKRE